MLPRLRLCMRHPWSRELRAQPGAEGGRYVAAYRHSRLRLVCKPCVVVPDLQWSRHHVGSAAVVNSGTTFLVEVFITEWWPVMQPPLYEVPTLAASRSTLLISEHVWFFALSMEQPEALVECSQREAH
jgi:hypothetical protein